jgi:membrane protein DedA with SNARE-associated domain
LDAAATPAADPARPDRPGAPSPLIRNAVIAVLVSMVAANQIGAALFPTLVNDHPLTLILLNASNRHLALASGNLDPLSFYGGGFLRLIAPDLFFFLLGRWYGDAAIVWMERKAPSYGELLRGLERWFTKARFAIVAIAPNNPVCLFAGAAGMSAAAFWTANVVGTVGRLVLIRAFSSAFEDLLGPVRDFIGEYRWPLTAVSVVLVFLSMAADRRGGRDGIGDLVNLPEGMAEAEAELGSEATLGPDRAPEAE